MCVIQLQHFGTALAIRMWRAIRWASDRIGEDAIVAFVTNNGFVDSARVRRYAEALGDGFLAASTTSNLKGNARTTGETRQKEGGNVFEDAIRVGVGITFSSD